MAPWESGLCRAAQCHPGTGTRTWELDAGVGRSGPDGRRLSALCPPGWAPPPTRTPGGVTAPAGGGGGGASEAAGGVGTGRGASTPRPSPAAVTGLSSPVDAHKSLTFSAVTLWGHLIKDRFLKTSTFSPDNL